MDKYHLIGVQIVELCLLSFYHNVPTMQSTFLFISALES